MIERVDPTKARSDAFELAPGCLIAGKYRLTRSIGEGGMGEVWAAEHVALGHEVAVKFLHIHASREPRHAARFEAEARMAAAIKHRFVVGVLDYGTTHDVPFMVLELLHGEELGARIQNGPALAVKDALRLIAQCLTGLEAVHRAGIVHRDLKPENIFLVRESDATFPKLLDFGIAQMNDDEASERKDGSGVRKRRLTQAGITVGTPSYMAPEQLRADRTLDARADLYSVGVILFELLTGRVPFASDNVADLLVRIMTSEPPRLYDLRPELGRELSDVLARAMARERERRFASAAELRAALEALIPRMPEASTVIQDGTHAKAIGDYTEQLLEAAGDPFAGDSRPRFRFTRARVGLPAVGLALALAGWFAFTRAGGAENALEAKPKAPAPISSDRHVEPAKVAPSLAIAQPNQAADPAKAEIGEANLPHAEHERRKLTQNHASHHGSARQSTHTNAPKKLFRKLDF